MAKTSEYIVTAKNLKAFCVDVYQRVGLPQEDAEVAADVLVEAELQGKDIQGVFFLERHVKRLRQGMVNPRPRSRVLTQAPGLMLLDGDGGLGQVVATRAMQVAIDRADEQGVCIVGVRNSNDFTMAGYYAMQAVARDMIGFCATSSAAVVPPFGGLDPVVSQGTMAWGIPAGKERPILVDMSQAVAPIGKIRNAARDGRKIPEGWAVNSNGQPIVDAHEALKRPILVPIGGYKGFALELVADVLAGVLMGAPVGEALPSDLDKQGAEGQIFYALKVSVVMPVAEFKASVDNLVHRIKGTRRAKGVDRIYVPGERALECREQRLKEGIPIVAQTHSVLLRLKQELKVEADLATV